ncbi:GNAT family N-acetyltransferase [Sutcliffiella halmapala]|uniref:GNAT family N-acetyltransferase n=1 Tax=Sutcliffiella halmapala TaxID=79882 RepID=UPI000994D031|nr:N-acetyltransferase [Sutcliffiella halmapala]
MQISIRQEQQRDYNTTENVIKNAFAKEEFSDKKEHELVSRLRNFDAFVPELSLVALSAEQEIVGHVLLSKITIRNDTYITESLALAPVSVLPAFQSKGIGKLLIEEALKIAKELNYKSVIVLGHPAYYPKFGFKRASMWGIKAPFVVSDEVFMALELQENGLSGVSGVVEYSPAFLE